MKKLFIIPFLLMFMVFIISCNNRPTPEKKFHTTFIHVDTSKFEVDTVKVVKMKHLTSSNLYMLHCKMCHGSDGKGDGVKARHDSTLCPYDLSKVNKPDKQVYYIVLDGENRMPNQHELSKDDVWVIVVYIKKFKTDN